MKKYILDTSVVVKWFSQEEGTDEAEGWLKLLEKQEAEIYLPALVKYELANALLKGKKLFYKEAELALKIFYSLPLIFVEENLELAELSYKFAEKLGISYYDACFLALAKTQKAILVTANPRHHQKIAGLEVISL